MLEGVSFHVALYPSFIFYVNNFENCITELDCGVVLQSVWGSCKCL